MERERLIHLGQILGLKAPTRNILAPTPTPSRASAQHLLLLYLSIRIYTYMVKSIRARTPPPLSQPFLSHLVLPLPWESSRRGGGGGLRAYYVDIYICNRPGGLGWGVRSICFIAVASFMFSRRGFIHPLGFFYYMVLLFISYTYLTRIYYKTWHKCIVCSSVILCYTFTFSFFL